MTASQLPTATSEQEQEAHIALHKVLAKPAQFPPANGLQVYEPCASDIIVTTFPKSGTTLTQQLTYQVVVATGGAATSDPDGMTFDDICAVVPFVDFGPACGFPPFDSSPRVFKSHLPANAFAASRVQKHVVVIRDPRSYPASWLDFLFDGWCDRKIEDPAVRACVFHEFVAIRLLGLSPGGYGFPYETVDDHTDTSAAADDDSTAGKGKDKDAPLGPWFLHARSWINAPPDANTLILFYEDMVRDLGGTADRVARFMGRTLSDAERDTVVQRCDRAYMAHDAKFMCQLEAKALGFPDDAMKAKVDVRDGFKQFALTEHELNAIDLRIQQQFGHSTYDLLREHVNHLQHEMHD